jgi:DNA-binding transcriptional LysR family regulator
MFQEVRMAEINSSRIKISQLRALVTIAATGSFSDAALHLDLSQSAVSHAIATLEEELGVQLLNRSRQGAVLTLVGQEITAEAQSILDSLDAIVHRAQLSKGLGSGQVRVACFRSVATHLLPAVIEKFRQQYPGISVSIDEFNHFHHIEDSLRQGKADIGFSYLPTSPEFTALELMVDPYVILMPPGEPYHQKSLTWEQLAQYSLIQTPVGDGCRYNIERYFQQHQQHLRFAYDVREDSTIISMVKSGLGITIIARLAAEPIPEDLVVAELPEPFARRIAVLTFSEALHLPAVYAFLDTIKTVCHQSHPMTS